MVVLENVFHRFPSGTSGQLSWARARAVCAPSLALIATRELAVTKYLLHNNPDLGIAVSHYLTILETCTYEDMVLAGWKYDPPKVISDLTESVIGAMFVDSDWDYELCKDIIEKLFKPLLDLLRPDLPRDPPGELLMWVAKSGCRKTKFK
jgi:endoribonuclease Dicer